MTAGVNHAPTGAQIEATDYQAVHVIDDASIPVAKISGLGTLATQSGTFSGTSSGTNTGDQSGNTPAVVLGTAAAAGTSVHFLRDDDTIVAFDATVPVTQALGDTAATGSATVTARRDHKHGMPALSTATPIVASGAGATGTGVKSSREDHVHPAGAGGITHAFVGYNTIGGSKEAVVISSQSYFKAFTAPANGMLLGISVYVDKTTSDGYFGMQVGVNIDNSGAPGQLVAMGEPSLASANGNRSVQETASGTSPANWFQVGCPLYCTSGTQYWLQVFFVSANYNIYYDTSGSDPTNNTGGTQAIASGQRYTLTNSTKSYSIRGDFIS